MEDRFFDALVHIMWEMDIDIFTQKDKTLALIADFVPKCKKQYSRLKKMYECGAMDKIEAGVSDRENYAEYMWEAVDLICEKLGTDEKKAVFSVNQIIDLWDGELPELDDSDESDDEESTANITEKGDEDMLFLQDVAEEEKTDPPQEEQQNSEEPSGGGEEEKKESSAVLKKIVQFWCHNDCEQGRPYMAACPVGWLYIFICVALGVLMVYDIPLGDKLVPPVFLFVYILLIGKRHYRFESVGRLSIAITAFYAAACARTLWIGGTVPVRCLPIVLAAIIVFNNGRFSSLLDGEKRSGWLAYLLIFLMSAAVTAGVYAIQNVQL